MRSTVLILGCGPAGLLAAQAAADSGHQPLIFSRRRKSDLFGCQYLHAAIPGLTFGEGRPVAYTLRGTAEGYAEKVYGPEYDGTVSPAELGAEHLAWDLRAAYDELWKRWASRVIEVPFKNGAMVRDVTKDFYDGHPEQVIISTIPARFLCHNHEQHSFHSEYIWAMGETPDRPVPIGCAEDTVVCNGEEAPSWYRLSRVFGNTTVEWPGRDGSPRPPFAGVALVEKPLRTNCNCNPRIVRTGRYGVWRKGVLSHEAYFETIKLLEDQQGRLF